MLIGQDHLVEGQPTNGFAIFLSNNLISSNSQKQQTVSRSSAEAKYKSIADTQ